MAHARGILRALTGARRRARADDGDRWREQVVEGMMQHMSPRLRQDEAERAAPASRPGPAGPIGTRGADRRR